MKNTLNPKLWLDGELKPEIREKLLEIANHFCDFLNTDIDIHDIILTGSMAGFSYNPNSDIDVHILIDFNEIDSKNPELVKNLMLTKKELYNLKRNITVKGYQVELYPQDVNQPHHSSGQYSLLFGKWNKQPKPIKTPEDTSGVLKISRIYQDLIDDVTQLDDPQLKLDLANSIKTNVTQRRKNGLEQGGETSKENLLFKKLRNSSFNKLFDAISHSTDKKLSLENFKKNN
jgi:predicted nucleotidyltransferase